jgi:hypothetical protein
MWQYHYGHKLQNNNYTYQYLVLELSNLFIYIFIVKEPKGHQGGEWELLIFLAELASDMLAMS